jgi:hypothetical protein
MTRRSTMTGNVPLTNLFVNDFSPVNSIPRYPHSWGGSASDLPMPSLTPAAD